MRGCLLTVASVLVVAFIAGRFSDPYEAGIAALNDADYSVAIQNLRRIGADHRKRALAKHVLYKAKLFQARQIASQQRFAEALTLLRGFPEDHTFSTDAQGVADALIAVRGGSTRVLAERADIKKGPGQHYGTVDQLDRGVEIQIEPLGFVKAADGCVGQPSYPVSSATAPGSWPPRSGR